MGFILLGLGLIKLFFFMPGVAINMLTQLPEIGNGSLLIIFGLSFFSIGVYRIWNKTKSFKSQLDIEKEIKEIEEKSRKKIIRH